MNASAKLRDALLQRKHLPIDAREHRAKARIVSVENSSGFGHGHGTTSTPASKNAFVGDWQMVVPSGGKHARRYPESTQALSSRSVLIDRGDASGVCR
jgi:hypothetical protein